MSAPHVNALAEEGSRAALDAAEARAVGVKPLVWHSKTEWHHFTDPEPGSPGNSQKMQYVIKHYVADNDLWDLYGPGHWGPGNKFATLELAQAAAQANYEARILSALHPASPLGAVVMAASAIKYRRENGDCGSVNAAAAVDALSAALAPFTRKDNTK